MDWSKDISVQAAPSLCVPLVEEHMLLPYVSLPQGSEVDNSTNNFNVEITVLNYRNNQLTDPSLWDGLHQALSIFENESSISINTANILCSLKRVATYISQCPITGPTIPGEFIDVAKITWSLINTIYISK